MEIYEKRKLMIKTSESEGHQKDAGILSVEDFVRKIKDYDVISFDIFDTLIFRPFSSPTDVFYLIGEKFDFLDFKNLRVWAEWDARMKCRQKKLLCKSVYAAGMETSAETGKAHDHCFGHVSSTLLY